jgi:photosystem II stability/assembly factor-like uncharacterized protein
MNSAAICLLMTVLGADPAPKNEPPKAEKGSLSLSAFRLRLVGPAVTSGRVVGFAVDPRDRSHYFVAVACGGVWKTTNSGTTWTPVFDGEGSFSIGYITLDPKNPNVVWVGTGENNSQRSVGYGDGIYKSIDGGKSWQNMGLKNSEHIGKIIIDPRDSNTIYVAAQGPLWAPGGDRGLYKTTDGGKTWNAVLTIGENTGITDILLDPRNPDVLIAASYQRRRHVWTLINGGPESAIHRSTDGGKTWTKIRGGLPDGELGRIGLAMAPSDPDLLYAIIEAGERRGGIFASKDGGVTWEKRNPFDQQAQYYAHLVVDPKNSDRVYVMGVNIQVTDDGARTLKSLPGRFKHVDNHTIWIDPKNTDYYLVGCDGGIYESFDRAANWHFKSNLPITQFYDVGVSEDGPFYHVYGGTQDNFTLGAPARTRSVHGIMNQDWYVVQGGDGFHVRVDPKDANIVYGEYQYGGLTRYDRKTGQRTGIQPQPGKGEASLRWNWDSPLIISPHSNKRLYFAANKLFKSDDQGNTWKPISGDLTQQLNRDLLPVMGKIWGPDAVSKHVSTSLYGNCVALAESPKKEGVIVVGTDDGLIQVTENHGERWTKIDKFPGIPERTYVSRLIASQHDSNTIYATFDNHKMGDFQPYLLKSSDLGKTWSSLVGDLPTRGSIYAIAEDHLNPNLLFVGTEFGLFATLDGGKKWHRLRTGLPTIAVHDLAIQKQMSDLVVGTFGRGIYILDDYSALRTVSPETLEKPASIFPVRDGLLFIQSDQFGGRGKGFLGESHYTAENPPFGVTLTIHLKESLQTLRQKRLEAERKGSKDYPTLEQLRSEAEEEAPAVILTILDEAGNVVRKLNAPTTSGMHRVTWDLREAGLSVRASVSEDDEFGSEPSGPLVLPGIYQAKLSKRTSEGETPLCEPVRFKVVSDGADQLADADRKELYTFQKEVAQLSRTYSATVATANDLAAKFDAIKRALDQAPKAKPETRKKVTQLIEQVREILRELRGDSILRARNENTPTSIGERIGSIRESQATSTAKPTTTTRESFRIAREELGVLVPKLKTLSETELKALEKELEAIDAAWVSGPIPFGKK